MSDYMDYPFLCDEKLGDRCKAQCSVCKAADTPARFKQPKREAVSDRAELLARLRCFYAKNVGQEGIRFVHQAIEALASPSATAAMTETVEAVKFEMHGRFDELPEWFKEIWNRRIEYTLAAAPAPAEPVDKGPWTVEVAGNGQWFIQSAKTDHDERLYVTGDFEEGAEEYANLIASKLNAAPTSPVVEVAAIWQPIETAPKDGTSVVLLGALWNDPEQRRRSCVSWYSTSREESPAHCLGWFFTAPGYSNGFNPTHWMPLPKAPDGRDMKPSE